ncbi:MoxR-like ATPase [Sporobacter termitidis DSM 10068]|uniref:MoxR-like ATPase n=1 Tax=Sporobacter termitidis DSM 10068 TaxID=1123282 RepID=A0A1M5YSR3_9FIRM|nr:MoxR family ATPase [Sporobacter termitidis]SHI15031.1 MoxR-like ATPase [Sporobacter termitidis DSM 10068]
MRKNLENVQKEIRKVVVGKDEAIGKVLMAIMAGGHVLLEDVPGVGKTTLTLAFARVLNLDTKRIQFTSDSVPSDVVGFSILDKRTGEFQYKPGAIMTNILLADEINRTSSKTQSALLEAMEEGRVTVDGVTHPLPDPFIVLATQNPVGSAGTQMLPNSQLDRFMIRLSMGYPDTGSQIVILRDRRNVNPLDQITPVLSRGELLAAIAEVGEVHIDDKIYAYVTALTEATRQHPLVSLGISPRGALALCRMTKARAYLSGRDFVVPEDVEAVVPDVYAHRLILGSKARFNEVDSADIVAEILQQVKMPVLEELKR